MFYAGAQNFVNQYFNFNTNNSYQSFYFNLCQQPVNMITGYQRQHRKTITYIATEGGDPQTTDQYTKLMVHLCNKEGINEAYSKSCELAAIAGLNLMQPYLDYTGDDPAQGQLKLKIWEYNSFLVDPYSRQPDFSDAQFIWCQEYISKIEAETRFPDKVNVIKPMSGAPQKYGNFYFLPENHNMIHNNLMVLSYIWYRWRKKKKRLYSKSRNQFFDFSQQADIDFIQMNIPDLEIVEMEVQTWKLATVLNDQLMFQGENPLGFDQCPVIPTFWNYEPHLSQYDLRNRSLIRTMRDPQFLFNYKVIQNNDIAAATINAGWKRKSGAVANEDNLKKAGQGWDIIINDGFELTDCEKIIPSAVPESDLALAQQMADLIQSTSGINMENWSAQDDKQTSSLTVMLKQAANLLVFQKYFDQWDHSLKLLGELCLMIVLNNWNAAKVSLIIGEEPTHHFYSRIFAKFHTLVEEGINTPTQKNMKAQAMMDINAAFGREVLPPSMIIKDMNIQGVSEIVEFLKQQEEQAAHQAQEATDIAHVMQQAQLKESYSKSISNMATASERQSRKDSNAGLYEERISEVTRNNALALKDKMDALSSLLDAIKMHGELESMLKMNDLEGFEYQQEAKENRSKDDAQKTLMSNEFLNSLLGGMKAPMDAQAQ
jgi:hypothetical protein